MKLGVFENRLLRKYLDLNTSRKLKKIHEGEFHNIPHQRLLQSDKRESGTWQRQEMQKLSLETLKERDNLQHLGLRGKIMNKET